mmetsp:Transcript_15393/g.43049  ORF Transcript_15393/g.43049 Transcript_15393/m.43049 type:complete len:106 (+) Transcript_15393:112-429(+)|eukprot:CAMPEP_0117649966 /NCGR_PEP_ID=MMETSP0804-20121206/1282_1 /TAXON_ID=1074897 /ORGANISM="Tetraselmis astigmatica, Strain CCMP880" /LENGTH=105 /DNA_ID=CAMNT_0005455795 /DNA_START=70 /DNA_END=387 /DNA_ORIENTATION=-
MAQPTESVVAESDEALAKKLQEAEGYDAVAVQAQRESDEEYARLLEKRLQEEGAQEAVARKEQEAASLEAEWDAANARVSAELDMRMAKREQRKEVYQSSKAAKE